MLLHMLLSAAYKVMKKLQIQAYDNPDMGQLQYNHWS